jgi:polyisoprenoid-binding protein YceI
MEGVQMSKATWVIDPSHTMVEFSVKHMMISSVKGRFSAVEGAILADGSDLSNAEINVTVDTASLSTRDDGRDAHLKSADFFDVENFPSLTFKSKQVMRDGKEYKLTGDLMIRGVSNEVVLDLNYEGQAKDPWGNDRIGISAEGKIDRKTFGLVWNAALETGGILVGDQVKISISAEAIKQA